MSEATRAPQGTTEARQAIIFTVGEAVIKLHEQVMHDRRQWFWHLLAKAERKAERIAEEAAQGPHSNGDATFCEVYAKTLPVLFTAALNVHEQALNDNR